MKRRILTNFLLSCLVIAAWTRFVFWISQNTNPATGKITPAYYWVAVSYVSALAAAVVLLVLRFFPIVDQEKNFLYFLTASANTFLGIGGIFFYVTETIPLWLLHYLMLNLMAGAIQFTDIFFFNFLFNKPNKPEQ